MTSGTDFSQRIKSIEHFRNLRTAAFEFESTGKFMDYWFSLPKRGLVPDKSQIELRGLGRMAVSILMLQSDVSGDWRVRLAGTAIVGRWGFEPTNSGFLDSVAPQNRVRLDGIFAQLFDTPCGVIIGFEELYTSGRILKAELPIFPLRQTEGQPNFLLGLVSGEEQPDHSNREELLAMSFYNIESVRYLNIGAGIPA